MSMFCELGSVSHGTLLNEDLLEVFAGVLERVGRKYCEPFDEMAMRDLAKDAREVDPETEEAGLIIDEMIDLLSSVAPPYIYFGTHEGDGADFGFWPDIEALEEAVRDGEVHKINDLSELDGLDYSETTEIMLVNDHGNVTYGYAHGDLEKCPDFHEVWSCV